MNKEFYPGGYTRFDMKPGVMLDVKDASAGTATKDIDEEKAKEFIKGVLEKDLDDIKKEINSLEKAILTMVGIQAANAKEKEDEKKKLKDPPKDESLITKDYIDHDFTENMRSIGIIPYRELSDDHMKNMSPQERMGYFAHIVRSKDPQTETLTRRLNLTAPTDLTKAWDKHRSFQRYKDMSEGVLADGGYLVPPDFRQQLMNLVRVPTNLYSMCTVIPVQGGGTIYIPTTIGTCTAYWVGEGLVKTESQATLGRLEWPIRKQAVFAEATMELEQDSIPALGGILLEQFRIAMNMHFNNSFFHALGAPYAIRGLDADIGANTTVIGAGALGWADLVNLEYALPDQWINDSCKYFMYRQTALLLRQITDLMGLPIWHSGVGLNTGDPPSINGYGIYRAPVDEIGPGTMGSGTGTGTGAQGQIYFGDPRNYWIFEREDYSLRYSDSHADNFQHNIRAYVMERRMGARMLTDAFSLLQGFVTYP